MSGLLKSHRTGLVVLAALLTFALTAASGYGWGTTEQPKKDESGEHADKNGKDQEHGQTKDKDESDENDEGKGEHKPKPAPAPGPTPTPPGPAGEVVSNNVVTNQVTNQVTNNVNTQVQANAEAESEAQAKAESESQAGPELAQAETEDEGSAGGGQSTAARSQPAQLASTGVNVGALALIGALCIGASLLLFRRRGTV